MLPVLFIVRRSDAHGHNSMNCIYMVLFLSSLYCRSAVGYKKPPPLFYLFYFILFKPKSFQIPLQSFPDKYYRVSELFSPVCVIKEQEEGFYSCKSIELYITIKTQYTHTHTHSPSLIWGPHSEWAPVSGRDWWKRLILRTGQKTERRPERHQRDRNDLWELKHRRPLPPRERPFNLAPLSASTWLSSEWKRKREGGKKRASHFSSL